MRPTLADIIADIEALEPALAQDRQALERTVEALLKARVDDEPREGFEDELLARVRTALASRTVAPSFSLISLPRILMQSKYVFGLTGALTGALVVIAAAKTGIVPSSGLPLSAPSAAEERSGTVAAGPAAFGSLKGGEQVAPEHSRSYGVGGGGGAVAMDTAVEAPVPANAVSDKMMIYPGPDMKQASYAYDGDITLPSGEVSVYRRLPPASSVPATNAIAGFAKGMLDWSKMSSSTIQNVNVTDKATGLNFSIDYQNGSVWINKIVYNDPYAGCTDPECYEKRRLKESDMLPDAQSVAIASAFAAELGIDLASYGTPEVTDDWRMWYARAEDKAQYYFPEQISVLFPLLIDGKRVYEEYGQPYGLQVTVDIRTKSATGLGNLYFGKFETSAYAAATDQAKVRELLRRGGLSSWMYEGAQTVNVDLSAPQEAFVHISRWLPDAQQSQELFVPALAFETKDPAEELMNGRKYVLVPLADEMLVLPEEGAPVPMPLEDGPAIKPMEAEAESEPAPAEAPAEPEPTPAN